MKKILASMIIIIELLCFCNTTIAMAIDNLENAEVQQEVAENSTKVENIEDSTEEKVLEENDTIEILNEENTEEVVTEQEVMDNKQEEQEVEREAKVIETEEVSKEITTEVEQPLDNVTKEESEENINDIAENNESDEEETNSEDMDDTIVTLTFPYNNEIYSVNISSNELGVNLSEYEYYFVKKISTGIDLYYSKERIYIAGTYGDKQYKAHGSADSIRVIIYENGTIKKSIIDIKNQYYVALEDTNYISSNQNIYYNNNICFKRNSGYEYNEANENQEECNEIIKINKPVIAYEKPALNYDELTTIKKYTAIKRIKKDVNTTNGYLWDKVQLMDGREAYIVSEDFEIIPDAKEISFKYNNKAYIIYLSSNDFNVNLENYAYYFVTKSNNTQLTLYCSDERIKGYTGSQSFSYNITCSEKTIVVSIKSDGSLTQRIDNIKSSMSVSYGSIVASNQNIYRQTELIFRRNCGYEYDILNDQGTVCNELIKSNREMNVYDQPALNYDIISTVQEGIPIKRVKIGVNNTNGKIWDKVELSDGKEAYIISEEVEKAEDSKKLSFSYNKVNYNIYLSLSSLNVNLNDYAYYFVTKPNDTQLTLYYSDERIKASAGSQALYYSIRCSEKTIVVNIKSDGSLTQGIVDMKRNGTDIRFGSIIASNQNIYCQKDLILSRNCGYKYDISNEQGVDCNELIKSNREMNVYDQPALNYDIISTVQEGIPIKRVKIGVNNANGKIWDKVELSDGKEAYIISEEVEKAEDSKKLSFSYNKVNYNIYLSSSSLNVNLEDYAYYFVTKPNDTQLTLYYSDERIKVGAGSKALYYSIRCSEKTIVVSIKSDGSLTQGIFDMKKNGTDISFGSIIASNQNLYYGNTEILKRNSGDIYNVHEEINKDFVHQIVRSRDCVDVFNIYDGPGLNYDIIATVPKESMFKRIILNVNIANGHEWDKIELNNGIEGYAKSDEIDWPPQTKTIKIPYQNKIYEAYIELPKLEMNFDDYKYIYYYAVLSSNNKMDIYLSKTELITKAYNSTLYETNYEDNTIKIELDLISGFSKYAMVNKGYTRLSKEQYIATNHFNTAKSVGCKICSYDDDLKVVYTNELNVSGIKRKDTLLQITEGESLYNSMTMEEREELEPKLVKLKNRATYVATFTSITLPNASKALSYFLTNGESEVKKENYLYEVYPYTKGHKMRQVEIDDRLVGEDFNRLVDSIINAVENIQNLQDGETIKFSNIPDANGTVTKEYCLDWFGTMNNYRIKTQSIFSKENDTYMLNLILGVEDYYDWEKKDANYVWNKVFDYSLDDMAADKFYELNRAGLARNYTNYGEINYNIKWQKGERTKSGKVIVTKGNN